MLLRHSDDGGGVADGQSLPAAGAAAVRHERRLDRACQRGLPAAHGEDRRQAAVGAEICDAARPQGAADHVSADRMRIRGNAGGEFALLPVPRFRREHPRDDVSHHRHHRTPEGGVFQPPAAGAAHARHHRRIWLRAEPGTDSPGRRLHAVDPDVSRPCLGEPVPIHHDGQQAGISGALCAGCPLGIDRARRGDVDALRADDPADAALRMSISRS